MVTFLTVDLAKKAPKQQPRVIFNTKLLVTKIVISYSSFFFRFTHFFGPW